MLTIHLNGSVGINDLTRYGASEYVYGHHKDKASFLASMREGCAMCNRFRMHFDYNSKLQSLGYFSVFHVALNLEHAADIKRFVMFVRVGNSSGGFDFVLLEDPKHDNNMNFDFGLSNHDSKAWSVMETWMRTCTESHTLCNRSETPTSYRPTRLLKLDSPHTFRLVRGAECPSTIQYVALSYCWGTKPAERLLRLLRPTFESLSLEQPVENLPKTFREAISVAQRFGVDYVWIDRLCIFQDSADDWHRESSSMQDVYRNALFSISALGAVDDEAGCFFERDPSKTAPTIVRFKLRADSEERAFRFGLEKGWSWRLSFKDEPLVQRSWVVQERLLAPRTLHFGSKQLFWECREASCCEMHPQNVYCSDHYGDKDDGTQEADRAPDYPCLWKQLLDAPDRSHGSDPYEQLFEDWNANVVYYVSRKLTIANDKLPALSGLANDMKARLQQLRSGPHRYLAGLWEEKLMDTLVWNVTGAAARSLQYRAPSWSWACLDGQLNLLGGCMSRETIYLTSMVSVVMTYLGKEDTIEVSGGVLTLAGPCALARIDVDRNGYMDRWYKHEKYVQSIQDDEGHTLYGRDESKLQVIFDTMEDVTEEAFIIWVCCHHFSEEKWYGHGLTLVRVEEDMYRRVGMATRNFANREDARAFSAGFSQKQIRIV
ncbi:heterokaryon incompatibility protein-domain-containing protein [Colletotrichum cereale]|nr:heterokaryon incompatibility protein-domain-containing protein [Colletotrichum cereale]